ncbi:hypothetical protein BCV71DRAFT_265228 [Rhizopus microsporus]|uniref:E3 ubiquitin-protein ligase listerin n=1 Tax=Rhizopus microsporus TaxID=58291 RepID=A0A1X0RY56_RHIZD|nr:hypothetical protein BCV71DRAFT_265228 [Rhizopus microsporus]
MGKSKQPRVKGNLKPASSSRAAELSASTANPLALNNLGGFAQFVSANSPAALLASPRPSTPSSVDSIESLTTDLDPELVVIFKKISKRDTVTKIKALEELEVYLQSNKHAIGLVLGSWVGLYGKLVLEVDRRVRLMANQVHTLVTTNVKKKLAPHLKDVMGPWLLSMHDQAKDIVRVARNSFESVFAADKRAGVISFCQKETLDYLTDMLLYKTVDTLSDARYVTKEDMLAKYARVVSSSFQILSYLITELPVEERIKCEDEYKIIMDDTTLWKKFVTHNNPLIRKSFYNFVKTLLLSWKDAIESRLELICPNFFAGVFVEKDPFTHSEMWDALLLMTKNFPRSWVIIDKKKPALPKLYKFLGSGLNGSVNIAYPSIIALLANLPEEIKQNTTFYIDVFDHLWKGLSSEYIDKSNFRVFLDAYTECIVYFAITLSKMSEEQSVKTAAMLIEDKFWNIIKFFFLQSRNKALNEKIDPRTYDVIANRFIVLASAESTKDILSNMALQLDQLFVQTVVDCASAQEPLDMELFSQKTGSFLTYLSHECKPKTAIACFIESHMNDMVKRLVLESVGSAIVHKDKSHGLLLLAKQLVDAFEVTATEPKLASATRQLLPLFMDDETPISSLTSFFVTTVILMKNTDESEQLWTDFIQQVYAIYERSEVRASEIVALAFEQIKIKNAIDTDYQREALDTMMKGFAESPRTGMPHPVLENAVCLGLIQSQLLSDAAVDNILSTLELILQDFNKKEHYVQGLRATVSVLNMLERLMQDESVYRLSERNSFSGIPSQVFDALHTSQKLHHDEDTDEYTEELALYRDCQVKATTVWDSIASGILMRRPDLAYSILNQLKKSIIDVTYPSSPSDSVQRVGRLLSSAFHSDDEREKAVCILLDTEEEWEKLYHPFMQHTTDYLSLAVTDPYVALSVDSLVDDEGELMPVSFDVYGLSSFGRLVLFWGEYLSDLGLAKSILADSSKDWLIRRLMLASVACSHELAAPGTHRIWEKKAVEGVRAFIEHIKNLFSMWLSTAIASSNLAEFPQQLLVSVKRQQVMKDNRLLDFTSHLALSCKTITLSANVLHQVISKLLVLGSWSASELESWLPLLKAESVELNLLTKAAIVSAFKYVLGNTDAYRHYQSDLCSKLSGVTSMLEFDYSPDEEIDSKRKRYWSLLGLLNSSALKIESFDIPRQRLLHLIQSLRPWLSQDFEFSEDQQRARARAQIAQLLKHLAKSVPDDLGGHWDYFLDCCFSWTAYADANQPEELLVLYYTLDLYETLVLLSKENEVLQEAINKHLVSYGKLLLELVVKEYKRETVSEARRAYQEVLARLLEHVPKKTLVEVDCFADLSRLLMTHNESLQKRAYSLLNKLVTEQVQDLSVKLEFTETSEEEVQAAIDNNILSIILSPPDASEWQAEEMDEHHHEIFGYLLAWMVMLDHFKDITFKLKQEYTNELKEKESVAHLMPVLCAILNVGQTSGSKPFNLSPWDVTEYDVEGFDGTHEMSFDILAAHLYYRALRHIPSLVRLWWIDCKNRQLTLAVEGYTEKHFSQPLINYELELLNRPDIKSQLEENEENEFTIKTLKAASEVTAKYVVDEQDMQIAIKLPSNYPLRQIEVEGVQKVGVNDKQWRGWMFAITAVIGSQVWTINNKEKEN